MFKCDHCVCTKYHSKVNKHEADTGECHCTHLEACHIEVEVETNG